MDLYLKDKVVLVTGGAKGIGESIVRTFANEGAKVVIINLPCSEAHDLVSELNENGADTYVVEADLCDQDACRNAVEKSIEKYGRIDILVNNAGVNDFVSLAGTPDDFSRSLSLSLTHY